ncbi:MAG: hypothetical protein RR827_04600 [Oscillospiraceae bacterium]
MDYVENRTARDFLSDSLGETKTDAVQVVYSIDDEKANHELQNKIGRLANTKLNTAGLPSVVSEDSVNFSQVKTGTYTSKGELVTEFMPKLNFLANA